MLILFFVYLFLFLVEGGITELNSFETRDGLYDCSWSEENERHVVTASGDGSIKLFDTMNRSGHPLKSYHEHTHEVNSVDWNLVRKDLFISGYVLIFKLKFIKIVVL
jgi:peroxin-7